jgi:GNAT superfamily N-acetyltransferase
MVGRRLFVRRIVTFPVISQRVSASVAVRRATFDDLPRLVELITAHAEYESSTVTVPRLATRLADTLIEPQIRAACFVAEIGTSTTALIGYATCTTEFATWSASEYLHMDTLYVDDAHRNHGIGRLLLNSITTHAAHLGLREVQWQTPDWNTDAVRFYERVGATATNKTRFKLAIPTDDRKSNIEVLQMFTTAWADRDIDLLRSCLHVDARYMPSVEVPEAPFFGRDNVIAGIKTMWQYDDHAVVTFGPHLQSGSTITRTWMYTFAARSTEYGVDIFTFADGKILGKDAYRRGIDKSG